MCLDLYLPFVLWVRKIGIVRSFRFPKFLETTPFPIETICFKKYQVSINSNNFIRDTPRKIFISVYKHHIFELRESWDMIFLWCSPPPEDFKENLTKHMRSNFCDESCKSAKKTTEVGSQSQIGNEDFFEISLQEDVCLHFLLVP